MINQPFIKKKRKEPSYPPTKGTLILTRSDLTSVGNRKSAFDINIFDFIGSMKKILMAPIVLFLDSDGTTKTLKNRYK